tara:strand:- start:25 stop:237 length:213 start_codon:yes stop_codon:yes gene_type:complete
MYVGRYKIAKTRKYHSFPVFIKRNIRYPKPKKRIAAINMKMRTGIAFRDLISFVAYFNKKDYQSMERASI